MKQFHLLLLISLCCVGLGTFANTLYVSPTSTFTLPSQAVSAAANGDTIRIADGIYLENSDILINKSLVIIRDNPTGSVIIDAVNRPDSTQLKNIIRVWNASNVLVDGLTLQNCIGYGARAIRVHGSGNNIMIRNCTIRNIGWISNNLAMLPDSTNAANAVFVDGDELQPLNNVSFLANSISNCATGVGEALTYAGYVRNSIIEGNVIDSISNIGIDLAGNYWYLNPLDSALTQARNITVRRNKISRCMSGRAISAGIYLDGSVNCIVEQNEVLECGVGIALGAEERSLTGTLPVGGHTVRNNKVHHNVSSGLVVGGVKADRRVRNVTVSNNSFFHNRTGARINGIDSIITLDGARRYEVAFFGNIYGGEISLTHTDIVLFQNNLVYPRNERKHIVVAPGVAITGFNSDYNQYFRDDQNFGMVVTADTVSHTFLNGINYSVGFTGITLQQYQSSTNLDAHSHFGDPKLTDTALHNYMPLSGSPMIDTGNPVYDPVISGTTDYLDSARLFGSRIDIGAYESTSTATNIIPGNKEHAFVLLFPNPTTGKVYFEMSEPVDKVVVRNMLGQSMMANNTTPESVDLSNLPAGLYILNLRSKSGKTGNAKIRKE